MAPAHGLAQRCTTAQSVGRGAVHASVRNASRSLPRPTRRRDPTPPPLRQATRAADASATPSALQAADVAAAKAALQAAIAADNGPAVASAADILAAAGPGPPPPAPSAWRTLFSDARGPSGGRVGPFMGRVSQRFHAGGGAAAGTYTNSLALGPPGLDVARLDLSGTWEAVRADRVNVVFLTTAWSVLGGLFRGGSTFEDGKQPRGHWILVYGDDEVRVFRTNKGSLFVLGREEEGDRGST